MAFACLSPFLAAPVAWVILDSPHSPNASLRGSTREDGGERLHWLARERPGERKGGGRPLVTEGLEREGHF